MMHDRWASLSLLLILVLGFVSVLERSELSAGLLILGMLVAPFSILLVFITRGGLRTTRGWDRPGSRGGDPRDDRRDWNTPGR